MLLSCPLCSEQVPWTGLEAHLRLELLLPACRCLLCPATFAGWGEVDEHFRGPLARHPGEKPQAISLPAETGKKERLLELLRLAKGGPEAVEQRLCVCGQCRLLCREDFGHGQSEAAPLSDHAQSEAAILSDLTYPQPQATESNLISNDEDILPGTTLNRAEHIETSAEEAPMERKPDEEDLKPKMSSDGKVACLQCGKRLSKDGFYRHAEYNHSPGNYLCLLCPFKTKVKNDIAKHQKRDHEIELTPETFVRNGTKDEVKEWVRLCFGEAKDTQYVGLHCRPCDKTIRKLDAKAHISKVHLKKALFKCKQCGHTVNSADLGTINKHVKMVHKLKPGPETVDSSGMERYAPIIKAMLPRFFDM